MFILQEARGGDTNRIFIVTRAASVYQQYNKNVILLRVWLKIFQILYFPLIKHFATFLPTCYELAMNLLIFWLCVLKKICSTAKNGLVWCDVVRMYSAEMQVAAGSLQAWASHWGVNRDSVRRIFWYISAQRQSTVFFHNIP